MVKSITKLDQRYHELEQFVHKCFNHDVTSIKPIKGDLGLRRYYRVTSKTNTYIAMDCPMHYSHIQPFINVAYYLQKLGFSAPKILEHDIQNGFLILEDFGTISVKQHLIDCTDLLQRRKIYHSIIDLLIELHEQTANDMILNQHNDLLSQLTVYTDELLIKELQMFVDYYMPYCGNSAVSDDTTTQLRDIWTNLLQKQVSMPKILVLRDYHVENMMYLPNRVFTQRLGLLDFQDARMGSPIYDLVSVLQDARLELSHSESTQYIKYFTQQTNYSIDEVMLNYHILGAQRNSRVLGVFARQIIDNNHKRCLQYIPLVIQYLNYNLSHPALIHLKTWFADNIVNSI